MAAGRKEPFPPPRSLCLELRAGGGSAELLSDSLGQCVLGPSVSLKSWWGQRVHTSFQGLSQGKNAIETPGGGATMASTTVHCIPNKYVLRKTLCSSLTEQPHLTYFLDPWPRRPLSWALWALESSARAQASTFPSWSWGWAPGRLSSCEPRSMVASPQLVVRVREVLPGEDHSWAGVHGQGQAVIEIHVIQPVLRHLLGRTGAAPLPLCTRSPCLWRAPIPSWQPQGMTGTLCWITCFIPSFHKYTLSPSYLLGPVCSPVPHD